VDLRAEDLADRLDDWQALYNGVSECTAHWMGLHLGKSGTSGRV
jgi:hypothetical protein